MVRRKSITVNGRTIRSLQRGEDGANLLSRKIRLKFELTTTPTS